MLSFGIDAATGNHTVAFTRPPSDAARGHAELADFAQALGQVRNLAVRDGDLLAGFSAPYTDLIDAFAPALPAGIVQCHRELAAFLARERPEPQGDGLQVNFHQHPFDTSERSWLFTLNQGRFTDFFFNRLAWHLAPTYCIVTPFPLHVDLESASTCNMNCPMCYRDMMQTTGQMDFDLFTTSPF